MAETHFDEWIARHYATLWPELFDPAFIEPTLDFLTELAGTGAALEFGIGTGRVALPLSRRGVPVHGIELSEPMLTQFRSQDEQIECFSNAARHLQPGGAFVIENFVPELRRIPPGETTHVFTATPTHVGVDEYDVVNQIEVSRHWWVVEGELKTFSSPHRYVWPAELDLMARLAGMALWERWSGWQREPFTSDSRSHVSVWKKVA